MKLHHLTTALMGLAATVLLAGCSGPAPAAPTPQSAPPPPATKPPVTLTVFAAASLTETLDQVIARYQVEVPGVTVVPTYDSSGTLKTQIQEGAECDVFLSAAQKQMNQLDGAVAADKGNPEGLDLVLQGSRMNLLENRVVLTVPGSATGNIGAFEDLGGEELELLCIGNGDVPVGAYSEEILTNLGILDTLTAQGKITYGSNVKEVVTQVAEGVVDAGIVYATDACSAGLTIVDTAGSDLCGPVVYPAAVLASTAHPEEATAFLRYLASDPAMEIFESVGFSAPS